MSAAMEKTLFNMKMTSKQLQRESKKSEKKSKEEEKKVLGAIKKGDKVSYRSYNGAMEDVATASLNSRCCWRLLPPLHFPPHRRS